MNENVVEKDVENVVEEIVKAVEKVVYEETTDQNVAETNHVLTEAIATDAMLTKPQTDAIVRNEGESEEIKITNENNDDVTSGLKKDDNFDEELEDLISQI